MVHLMRQELFVAYPMAEIESLIHYCFQEICGMNRMDLMLQPEAMLNEDIVQKFQEVINRLQQHEPIQYIFGHASFYGLDILLNENVLIPRPETEELVNWVLREQSDQGVQSVLDIGTGSGCIALALKSNLPQAKVTAIDVAPKVVEAARQNAAHNQLEVEVLQRNILNQPGDLGTYDLIVSNPPYVTRSQMGDMMPNVLNYEPHLALFIEDDDPLKFYKAIGDFCQKHLSPKGVLYLEINEDLAADTAGLLESYNFTSTTIKKDLNGKFRMVKAMW